MVKESFNSEIRARNLGLIPGSGGPLKFGPIQTSKICQIAWFYNMSFWFNYYLREIQLTQVYLQWIILIFR